jgi:hypothetical protein
MRSGLADFNQPTPGLRLPTNSPIVWGLLFKEYGSEAVCVCALVVVTVVVVTT